MRSRIKNGEVGFTLMEMLVVLAIFSVIGVIATSSLSSIFRGAVKTDYVKEIKQNGDYAISVIETTLRNGTIADANCAGAASTSLQVISATSSAIMTTFTCQVSGSLRRLHQDSTVDNFLTNTSVDIPACNVGNISFTCSTDPTGVKQVSIRLDLQQANTNASTGERTRQTFVSRVTLRNR